jgi:tetratricopeptide (TPR) repeat protein
VGDPLAVSRHPAVRLAAKQVLIDAHLGAAHDIAWGPWEQKEKAVPRWLDRAAALAKDLAENEPASAGHQFRVATRALSAYVGLKGQLDATPWTEAALAAAEQLLASTEALEQKQRIAWDLGMALYDVVQICQMRGEHDLALQHGKKAVQCLELGAGARKASSQDAYLLGRLYFRLGAIHAVGHEDHPAALDWFDKATPVLDKSADQLDQSEWGRLGQTYVSMGVSYWETGQRDRAVELTRRGVELVNQAVSLGALKQSALEIPYSNLAAMLRQMGQNEQADQYFQQAKRSKGTTTR